ncbi:nicotinate-nucleotide pyrophosphorylase [Marinomonas sp. SBI22]|uniref:carboxylating nicotinate-nucleotide diphosphorylase n=1 Tax=unclassified Marinomonas TaxID=196814 RepID=UPI0007AF640C|nr:MULTISPECIES: carboxylating nicotinate-nucleotide diphosphorylase [unclassified Marinomonas]KZM38716.1 nicotinate-nucleotide pyrophosphorylase [Marinomonas sp. SBI22]KZM39371.1 nicotinate-nucleotide pyrophosphorylase [Marinomonas sp. SBI8L]
MTPNDAQLQHQITSQVSQALAEDIGSGDITAQLIPSSENIKANVITRENAILCGKAWVEEVFKQLDQSVEISWFAEEGEQLSANQKIFSLSGNARSILTGERCALNFLQSLSYTASVSREYAQLVAGTKLTVLDTRKTIPGWRLAQKYAVTVGGAQNHRVGLYDAFLIKENHIMAAGSIENAVKKAQTIAPGKTIEVETESLAEVEQAVEAGADIIMLDNFSLKMMEEAVSTYGDKVKFEASGNMTKQDLLNVANTGVDFVSVGALTKHLQAIDLSLRVVKD